MDPTIVSRGIAAKWVTLNPTSLPNSTSRYLYLDVLLALHIKHILENEVGREVRD